MQHTHLQRTRTSLLLLAGFICASVPVFSQLSISTSAAGKISALVAEKATRNRAQQKLDSQIYYAAKVKRGQGIASGIATLPMVRSALETNRRGLIHVDIKARVTPELLGAIGGLGGEVENAFPQYDAVRAWLPLLSAETLAGRADVRSIRPAARVVVNAGPDVNGMTAHAADVVQAHGISGAGVKVGVLSDGVDSLADEQAAGRLPSTVTVLSGQRGSGSEGTALLEIIYSLAPGAELYFATAYGGDAQMAANIQALGAAGCQIIVDDMTYLDEPVFQDGMIAQAVNSVAASGVLYFSSAANLGNLDSGTSGTWEGDFVDSGTSIGVLSGMGTLNQFGASNNNVLTTASTSNLYAMQWADPFGASCNDYDLFILDSTLSTVLGASTNVQTCSQDPVEVFWGAVPDNSTVVIVNALGLAAPRAIHLDTEGGRLAVATAGATFGHNAAAAAITVAATDVARAGGGIFTGGADNPPEFYSADGPRKIFYDPAGNPITPGNFLFATNGGTTLAKVDLMAADGVTTGVTDLPFYGTSAAAPHAAAIAALVMSAYPGWDAAAVKNALLSNALPVTGYDSRTVGSGIVMANRATLPTLTGLTIHPDSLARGASATVTATLGGPAPTGGASVSISSSDPAFSAPGTLVVPAGETSSSVQGVAGIVSIVTPATVTAVYNGVTLTAEVTIDPASGGTIQVNATLNGLAWTGAINYTLTGPVNQSGTTVPGTYTGMLAGSYTLAYVSGGPAGAALSEILPAPTQTISEGGTLTFTLSFTGGAGGTPPTVSAAPPSAITTTTATLNGFVNPDGADTHAWFTYWSCDPPCVPSATPEQDAGSGSTQISFSANITGLTANTKYYYQAWASNIAGTSQSSISNFTTVSSYTISGQVTYLGAPLAGVSVALGGSQNISTTTNALGQYSFPVTGPNYTITPSRSGYRFTPSSQSFTDMAADHVADFTAFRSAIGDFDRDGYEDLLWQNAATLQTNVNYYGGDGPQAQGTAVLNGGPGLNGWTLAGAGDFDHNGVPDLVWQNTSTGQVNINYYGGAKGTSILGFAVLNSGAGTAGWSVVAVADVNGDGVPDLIWQNHSTGQVNVNYYGGGGGAKLTGFAVLNSGAGTAGWSVVAAADFDGNGTPDLVWQNAGTGQVKVDYYGGTGGATLTGSAVLDSGAGTAGWTVRAAADMNADGVPDLIWENTSTSEIKINYYSGAGGAIYKGATCLNCGAAVAGLTVSAVIDYDSNGEPDLVLQNNVTGAATVAYYGLGGAVLQGWSLLNNGAGASGWKLMGSGDFNADGIPDLVWQNTTTGQVNVNYYGGPRGATLSGFAVLNNGAGTGGWSVVAVADFNGDGVPDLIWQKASTGQVNVNYYGGPGGATLTGYAVLNSGAGTSGWRVVAAADFDNNGTPDLVWQNTTTGQVNVNYYAGNALTGYAVLGYEAAGWVVTGAADFDDNGVPDLVTQNQTTGQAMVNYYGGPKGSVWKGWNWLNASHNPGWRVLPARSR
jgi:FG-GAP-like repeat